MRKRILVLGYDNLSGLAVVRSLGRAGYEIHVAWPTGRTIAAASRYVARRHDIPLPGSSGWQAALINLVTAHQIDLVLPCNDEAMVPVYKHRAELAAHGRFYTINDLAFECCFDKSETSQLAKR